MQEFNTQLQAYVVALQKFIEVNELPPDWFGTPDYIALTFPTGDSYESALKDITPRSDKISEIKVASRRIAAISLAEPVAVAPWGSLSWLEFKEMRPKADAATAGFEYMMFYYTDFAAVQTALDARGILYKLRSNPAHAWLDISISPDGQELKITDKSLAEIIAQSE